MAGWDLKRGKNGKERKICNLPLILTVYLHVVWWESLVKYVKTRRHLPSQLRHRDVPPTHAFSTTTQIEIGVPGALLWRILQLSISINTFTPFCNVALLPWPPLQLPGPPYWMPPAATCQAPRVTAPFVVPELRTAAWMRQKQTYLPQGGGWILEHEVEKVKFGRKRKRKIPDKNDNLPIIDLKGPWLNR